MSVTKHLVYNTITHLNANVCTCSHYELSRAPVISRLVASLSLARILLTCSRRTMYFTSLVLTILCLLLFSTFSYLLALTQAQGQEMFSLGVGSLLSSCLLVIRCALLDIFRTLQIFSPMRSVQLGVQTLPLLLSGELFPADVRATCKVRTNITIQNKRS